MVRNFSQASANNSAAIAERMQECLQAPSTSTVRNLLEIGSGSGQHAMYFSSCFPNLVWQPTEMPDRVHDLALNLADARTDAIQDIRNIQQPVALDVTQPNWCLPCKYDAVFTANTLHIMPMASVEAFFLGLEHVLAERCLVCVYGPLKYAGDFTTPSNEAFDRFLKNTSKDSGIRDFERLDAMANEHSLTLWRDFAMPANNQLVIWRR